MKRHKWASLSPCVCVYMYFSISKRVKFSEIVQKTTAEWRKTTVINSSAAIKERRWANAIKKFIHYKCEMSLDGRLWRWMCRCWCTTAAKKWMKCIYVCIYGWLTGWLPTVSFIELKCIACSTVASANIFRHWKSFSDFFFVLFFCCLFPVSVKKWFDKLKAAKTE